MTTHHTTLSRFALIVILTAALVAALIAPADAASNEERRLTQTQAQLDVVKAQIEAARGERSGRADSLAAAQQQLDVVLDALNAAELAVQRQQEQVAAAGRELDRLQDAQAVQQRVMANRAVALYRQGSGASMGTILSADSTEEALLRSTYVEILSRADRSAFESVGIAQVATDAQRRVLESEEATLARVAEQQERIVADVRALRDDRALVLADTENRLRDLEAQERHLESESREIAAIARRVAREAAAARTAAAAPAPAPATSTSSGSSSTAAPAQAAAPAPAVASGGWTWPASGPVTSEYGRRWGRMHEGVDIGAPTGAPVVSTRAGTVSFAGRMGGYGNLVLVDHGGGIISAYAHMSAFAVSNGASVGAGQRLGSIGCSGSCTGPHLHFEIRVNGAARNPRNYLG